MLLSAKNKLFHMFLMFCSTYVSSFSRKWLLSWLVETLACSIESRSRTVTVLSSFVWPSMVMQKGVPASSYRR